jgi:hypothetical protein
MLMDFLEKGCFVAKSRLERLWAVITVARTNLVGNFVAIENKSDGEKSTEWSMSEKVSNSCLIVEESLSHLSLSCGQSRSLHQSLMLL